MYKLGCLPLLTCLAISSALASTTINNVGLATYLDPDKVLQKQHSNTVVVEVQAENSFLTKRAPLAWLYKVQEPQLMDSASKFTSSVQAYESVWSDYRRILESSGKLMPLLIFADAWTSRYLFVVRYENEIQK